ncbi:MAG: deoxyribose-phosphate aldolase, partial [Desulfosporosinus sp.]
MIIKGEEYSKEKIARMIDQTILAQDATESQVKEVCRVSKEFVFKSVCTNPYWTPVVAKELQDTEVDVCFVIGFPLGATPTTCKVFEAGEAIKTLNGKSAAIDMVANIGLLKAKNYKLYTYDIGEVVKIGHDSGLEVKAILETGSLTEEEIKAACECSTEAGVDLVKTSTGKGGFPLIKDVMIMRNTVPKHIGVKFSGYGSINATQLMIMGIAAGANRLGSPIG